MSEICARDHLFISYASEDWALAEWLTLRLTADGYRVWCNRFQLLGGEPYPRDAEDAIRNRTFRVIGLLSRASMSKPNLTNEHRFALNIARGRHIEFLIPLNVDGLSPADLDWMISGLPFIPFHESWAAGLSQLRDRLILIEAPRPLENGEQIAADARESLKSRRSWHTVL